jgi:DNA-binding NarL/FixJ family response regulator
MHGFSIHDGGRTCVLAVDDQPAFRTAVRELVDATTGMVMVGEADSGERAVELLEDLSPDLVLMDVSMPGIGGIGAAWVIKTISPETLVVLLSAVPPDELPDEAAASPADALVWKSDLRPGLLEQLWERLRASSEPPAASAV